MGERLSGGNVGIALLANTLATGAALVALIFTFGSVSGAHFNPAVSFADASQGGSRWMEAGAYSIAQVMGACARRRADAVPFAVGAYITAACWFTASTSFANPAVTLARAVTDTFAGIRPVDVPGFLVGQTVGAGSATLLFRWLVPPLPAVADLVVVPHQHSRL